MRKFIMVSALAAFALAGCTTIEEESGMKVSSRTKTGALIGAGVGAAIGAVSNKKGDQARKNAMIGAGIGALAGAGVGNYMDRQQQELRDQLRGSGVSVQRVGDTIVLNMPSDVTFSTGSADIDAKFFPVLDEVAQILNQYPATFIDVVGHADSQGGDDFNLDLSERRANSTAGYLANRKVKSERIYIAGMGERVPIASNDTAEGRAKNRRVEITLRPMVD